MWRLLWVLLLCWPLQAMACKCSGPGEYDVVFEGRVVSISKDIEQASNYGYAKVVFEVLTAIKGVATDKISIQTASSLLCGRMFALNKTYTIYALNEPVLHTRYCYGREF